MTPKKNLTKDQLSDLMVGNIDLQMNTEILNTDEVKALMDSQWNNPLEAKTSYVPDLKSIFNKIKKRTHPSNDRQSTHTEFLMNEVQNLKFQYSTLRKRFGIALGIAASVILIITLSTIYVLDTNQVFKKTFTENIAPKGQKSNVILPDGTKAYLNSGSALRYDNFFGKKYRNIQLVGEAYFEVTRNEKLPFIINADEIEIKVLGTKFNVMAYPEDNFVETMVKEGKVSVTDVHGKNSVFLTANQKATFHKDTKQLLFNNANADLYTSWKENLLIFDNENFADVIKKLERWYDVTVMVQGTDSIKDRFTLTIKSESLREVLELISYTTDIEYTIKANQVTITYK
jgi:transmembrane sensor